MAMRVSISELNVLSLLNSTQTVFMVNPDFEVWTCLLLTMLTSL